MTLRKVAERQSAGGRWSGVGAEGFAWFVVGEAEVVPEGGPPLDGRRIAGAVLRLSVLCCWGAVQPGSFATLRTTGWGG